MPAPPIEHLFGSLSHDGFELRRLQMTGTDGVRLEGLLKSGAPALVVAQAGSFNFSLPASSWVLRASHVAFLPASGPFVWTAKTGPLFRLLLAQWSDPSWKQLTRSARIRGGTLNSSPEILPGSQEILMLATQLASPSVLSACMPIWYQAKTTELASLVLFQPEPGLEPVSSHEQNSERVRRALLLLERDLANPPTLEMLATEVGCGAFHLSRLFAEHVGRTMPEFLRQRRMEKAATLLRTTRQSISEIALDVGYESFSAFTRAFVRELGKTPSEHRIRERKRVRGSR